jgi:crotonobetainyl-CoA:carnitine CoA-transferase CaiB-like acyl-CoA transferase
MNSGKSLHVLDGLKVLDVSRVMSGPYASMLLGDYGAKVIKVEDTATGDETREWYPPTIDGESAYYLSANRNKKGIALNLKTPEGQKVFYKIAERSDVIIENFRPGVAERLGIDYKTISRINPKIVYCSISGFGQTGPNANLPGYDLIVFAMGGIMSFTGEEGRPPVRVSVPIADMCAGLYSVTAILAALRYREQTGRGQSIDVSMQDVQVSLLTHQAMSYFATGKNPNKLGSSHANLAPYQAFIGSDGEYFVLAIGNDKLWNDFCEVVGKSELSKDQKFKSNPDRMENKKELIMILNDLFSQKPADFWIQLAQKAGVPAGPISKVSQVLSDQHVISREMVLEVDNPRTGKKLKQIGTAVKFSDAKTSIRLPPPAQGEHTFEILRDLGYTKSQIQDLLRNSVVKASTLQHVGISRTNI